MALATGRSGGRKRGLADITDPPGCEESSERRGNGSISETGEGWRANRGLGKLERPDVVFWI